MMSWLDNLWNALLGKFICMYCGDRFKTMALLASHVNKKHKGQWLPIKLVWK